MAHYTLRQLKYFVTVVECSSIAEASRQLHIAQPSISQAIKGLEDSFGVQLFIRHHAQGVSLTSSGRRFYTKAQELLKMSYNFEQNALADNDVVSGQIAIGCFETAAPLYLPRLMAGFRHRYPGVEIHLYDGEQNELIQGMSNGRFDLAIMYRHDIDDSILTHSLNAPEKPYVLLPADHPLAQKSHVTLRELSQKPMILLDVLPSKHYFVSLFTEQGLTPQIAFASPSIEMVRGMVGQGLGFSILVTRPHSNYTYDGQRVAMVELAEEVSPSTLVIAKLKSAKATKPAQLFMDYCIQQSLLPMAAVA